jgi:hypothetical protein
MFNTLTRENNRDFGIGYDRTDGVGYRPQQRAVHCLTKQDL